MGSEKLTAEDRFHCPLLPYRFYPKASLKPATSQQQKWARFNRMQERWGRILELRNRLENAGRSALSTTTKGEGHE